MFPEMTIAFMFISGALCIVIPLAAMMIYKKKNRAVSISSFFIGGAVFILFALILEQILHYFMLPAVSGNTSAYVLYGAFAAGIFEETGRFAAFKTVMKKRSDPKEAVMFGLGHGGTEAILLAGLSLLSNAVTAVMTNKMGLDAMVTMASAGNPESAGLVRSQLEAMAAMKAGVFLVSVFERIIAVTFHTAMSVMVFEGARVKGNGWLFPVCILCHAALDIPAALYQKQVISLYTAYIFMAIMTAAAVLFAVRSYKSTHRAFAEDPVLPDNCIEQHIQQP